MGSLSKIQNAKKKLDGSIKGIEKMLHSYENRIQSIEISG